MSEYTLTVHVDIHLSQALNEVSDRRPVEFEVISIDIPQDVEIGDTFSVDEMLALEEHCLRT